MLRTERNSALFLQLGKQALGSFVSCRNCIIQSTAYLGEWTKQRDEVFEA